MGRGSLPANSQTRPPSIESGQADRGLVAVIGSSDPAWRSSTLAAGVDEGGMSPHGNSMSDASVHTLPTPLSLCKESAPLTIPTPPPPALEPTCRTLLGHALHACTFHILSTCSLMTKSGGESQLPVLPIHV